MKVAKKKERDRPKIEVLATLQHLSHLTGQGEMTRKLNLVHPHSNVPNKYDPKPFDREKLLYMQAWQATSLSIDDAILCFGLTEWGKRQNHYESIINLAFEVIDKPKVVILSNRNNFEIPSERMEMARPVRVSAKYYESKLRRGEQRKLFRKLRHAEDEGMAKILKAFPIVFKQFQDEGKVIIRFLPPPNTAFRSDDSPKGRSKGQS